MIGMESVEPTNEVENAQKPREKSRIAAQIGLTIFGLVILGVAAWFGYSYYQKQQFVGQVPSTIRQNVNFPIYLPRSDEVAVNRESISYSSGIFQYTASVKNVPVVVTEQPKTSGFDINKFATSQTLSGAQQSNIAIGALLSATLSERPLHIIDTDETIITITSTQQGAAAMLLPVSNSLTKL